MNQQIKLQILFLQNLFEKTNNSFIASCISYLWKEIGIHGMGAKGISPKQKYHIERMLKEYGLEHQIEKELFYTHVLPKYGNINEITLIPQSTTDIEIETKETLYLTRTKEVS